MCFGVFEVGMLTAHFVCGPGLRQIIGGNLSTLFTATLEPRRFTANFLDVRTLISRDLPLPWNL